MGQVINPLSGPPGPPGSATPVDPTDTNPTRNKGVSNLDAKHWEDHRGDVTGNPHAVTAAQVGALTQTQADALFPILAENVAALRLLSPLGTHRLRLAGYYSAGDGGGGDLYVDSSDATSADNGITVFVAANGARVKRDLLAGGIRAEQGGAKGDGITDDTAAINATEGVATALTLPVLFASKTYVVSQTSGDVLKVHSGAKFKGNGRGLSTIKVKAGAGDYFSVISAAAGHSAIVDDVVVEDVTVDQNNTGNPVASAVSQSAMSLFNGYPRYAAYLLGSRNVAKRCSFADIDSVNTLVLGTSTSLDVSVENCLFSGIGTSPTKHDHSTLYLSGTGLRAVHNTIRGVASGFGARTAIETHGAGQTVTDNQVYNMSAGVNVTGVIGFTSDESVVSDNVLSHVMNGISLWSYFYGSNRTLPALRDCSVEGNTVLIDRDMWTDITGAGAVGTGIQVILSNTAPVEGLKISNNTVRLLPFDPVAHVGPSNEYTGTGIGLTMQDPAAWSSATAYSGGTTPETVSSGGSFWIALAASTNVTPGTDPTKWQQIDITNRNVTVEGNTVQGSLGPGVRHFMRSENLRIKNNAFLNPGQTTVAGTPSSYRCGLLLTGYVTNGEFDNNTLTDSLATHVVTGNVTVAAATATAMIDCSAKGNALRLADGASVPIFVTDGRGGNAFYVEHVRTTAFVSPGNTKAGSRIIDLTTGQLYVQTAAPNGSTWVATSASGSVGSGYPVPISGQWYGTATFYSVPTLSNTAMVAGRLYATPFLLKDPATFNTLGVNVGTAGASGVHVRFGLYASNTTSGLPAGLLLDSGDILADTTGDKTAAVSTTLAAGLYWLVCVSDGTPSVMMAFIAEAVMGMTALSSTTKTGQLYRTFTYGALPDPFGTLTSYVAAAPAVMLKSA